MRVHLIELTDAARRADEALVCMEPRARDELAKEAQRRASALGLMRGPSPIPLVLSPCALPREELAALGRGARLITSALVKVARDLIERRPEKARLLFHHLSPLESAALQSRWREAEELLHSRIDWFVGRDGGVKALEVNATIPAMQVYSDAAAGGWVEAVAPSRANTLARNPSNAAWLIDALLTAARRHAARARDRGPHLHSRGRRARRRSAPRPLPSLVRPLRRSCIAARKGLPRPGKARDVEPGRRVAGDERALRRALARGRERRVSQRRGAERHRRAGALDPAARRHRRCRARGR